MSLDTKYIAKRTVIVVSLYVLMAPLLWGYALFYGKYLDSIGVSHVIFAMSQFFFDVISTLLSMLSLIAVLLFSILGLMIKRRSEVFWSWAVIFFVVLLSTFVFKPIAYLIHPIWMN